MEYRREIDGLRALAVLPVIFFHAGYESFSGGFVGVDVFFVISGYLITKIILSDLEHGRFSIVGFYERRARRILPALFFVMLVCLPFAWRWLLPGDMKDFSQSLVAVVAFSSNLLFWKESGYFDVAAELKPLLHTWSLAVEEQYYLFFPVFLMLAWRIGKGPILLIMGLLTLGSLVLAEWGVRSDPALAFYLLPTRGWELLVGAFVAFYLSSKAGVAPRRDVAEAGGLLGFLLLVYSVFTFDEATPFPGLSALVPTAGTALVILCSSPATAVGRWLGSEVAVGIGLISYSAYLWHQPLFAFLRHRSLTEPSGSLFFAMALTSLFLAYLTWRFVETPFRNKAKTSRSLIFGGASAGLAFFGLVGVIGHVTDGYFGRNPDDAALLIQKTARETGRSKECWEKLRESGSLEGACVLGDDSKPLTFALFGDSHAATLANQMDLHARRSGVSGYDFTYIACSPIRHGSDAKNDANSRVCSDLRRDFFDRLERGGLPRTIVVFARWTLRVERSRFDNGEGGVELGEDDPWIVPGYLATGYVETLGESIKSSVMEMIAAGHRVVLVYPAPEMGWSVPLQLVRAVQYRGVLNDHDASVSLDVFRERNKRTYRILDEIGEHEGLVRVRPAEFFCDTYVRERCVGNVSGLPLYYDDDHLSNFGAGFVVGEIMKHVLR
ncbi:acyltransferase family protein [Thauera phenylacetica]|uniref:Acyltransferase 3 n=1 Tax=Thauera phenylacetica B4P TaxID=1234382 RepID=N6ZWU0_9RHOO|nr:acyltransferase family protein [Thauera phenylacetica]ENO98912.1 acyltransferase 3 [Thauera phenylacetica B4P]